MTEYVTSKLGVKLPPGTNWVPVIGEETDGLLKHYNVVERISSISCDRLKEEAVRVLARCGNPKNHTHKDTGLVFGYIQSGKTMSYTALMALARDNNYKIIIVIAGLTSPLYEQTKDRLEKDLRLASRMDRAWTVVENPGVPDAQTIQNVLNENKEFPKISSGRTILITVLKNAKRLKNLIATLKSLDLADVPTLIIDDEGDQASLNTLAQKNAKLDEKGMSTIYSRIRELKSEKVVPNHTLLQYTATPQGPFFLLRTIDILAPSFIELLNPGEKYVGGTDFFKNHPELIRVIPSQEIYDKDNQLSGPPDTLLDCLRLFFMCVALGRQFQPNPIKSEYLSMMVHPSQLTAKHNTFYNWIRAVKKRWIALLKQPNTDLGKKELLSGFKAAYDDLRKTNTALPDFSAIDPDYIRWALTTTGIHELNARTGTTNMKWDYSNILVGGQVMDRGFTVKGLIMTYMPRGIGSGNADTIQQRARFFGYKRDYLSFCRVFLGVETKDAYEDYLSSEEHLRKIIEAHNLSGEPLSSLRRVVQLDHTLRPTRPNILSGVIKKYREDDWIKISAPHDSAEIIDQNRAVVEPFLKKIKWRFNEGHKNRTEMQIHQVSEIPLKKAVHDLLALLTFTRDPDNVIFTTLVNSLCERVCANPALKCTIYLMSQGKNRERTLTVQDTVVLFQGENPGAGKDALIYPGDSKIKNSEQVTIQVYKLSLKDRAGKTKFKDVYSVAIRVPEEFGRDYQVVVKNE